MREKLYIYHVFISHGDKDKGFCNTIDELINQLDYIQFLGCNAIMSNPIFECDSYHGYDIRDFYKLDPKVGTMEDFNRLMKELENRGMYFIMDITLAHTGDNHVYFKDFIRGKNDFYIFKDHISDDFGTDMHPTIHHWREDYKKYVLAAFGGHMPSLNVESKSYREEIKHILNFWMTKSPNIGLRLDAILHSRVTAKNHDPREFIQYLKSVIDSINPDAPVICEVWDNKDMYNKPIEFANVLGNAFNFYNSFGIMLQVKDNKSFEEVVVHNPHKSTNFLCNHDTARIATMLNGDREKVKLALKVLIQKCEGDVSIYYGTEADFHGDVVNGYDLPVRQSMTIDNMVDVIRDKNSLMYYIKYLIEEDKLRRVGQLV